MALHQNSKSPAAPPARTGYHERKYTMHLDPSQKDGALQFLEALKQRLEGKFTNPAELREHVRGVMASSKAAPSQEYMSYPEGAFLHTYIIRDVFALIREQNGFSDTEARLALLCEGFKNIPNYSSGSPNRTAPHPFDKTIATPTEIFRKWKGQKKGSPLTRACPDFAIRTPFPFPMVFELKFFERGEPDFAARQLVKNIYEAFFYRALPYVVSKKGSPAWDYNFSCLLACDASEKGTLKAAWDDLGAQVRNAFWEDANVYVMILRAADP